MNPFLVTAVNVDTGIAVHGDLNDKKSGMTVLQACKIMAQAAEIRAGQLVVVSSINGPFAEVQPLWPSGLAARYTWEDWPAEI